MIVVTGANGTLGRAIVKSLLLSIPADQVAASVRDPAKASELQTIGVCVHQANYDNPDSLRKAFKNAKQVLMISSNAAAYGGDPLVQHRNVIDAAKNAGVGRLVYTSHMGASVTSAFSPMHTHHTTEQMLLESGLPWTALRNGFYASSIITMLRAGFEAGVIAFPDDGKVSWTAHADLAAAAAAVLTVPGRFEGPTPPLTAAEALDLDDIAKIASQVLGHPVQREIISDDQMSANLAARGLPAPVIAISLSLLRASRNGEFAKVDPTLAELIGRPTTQIRSLLVQQ